MRTLPFRTTSSLFLKASLAIPHKPILPPPPLRLQRAGTMAVPPKFSAHQITTSSLSSSHSQSPHTLEIYLDYVCPFSAKIFRTLSEHVVPLLQKSYREPGVRIIFRQQIQPWHPSSTLTHEAGVAVSRLAPEKFWEFSRILFEHQKEYFDVNVVHEARNETYKRLAKLAGSVEGIDGEKVLELLLVPSVSLKSRSCPL
jgi:hypothetical protein